MTLAKTLSSELFIMKLLVKCFATVTPEPLRDVFMTRRYTNPRLPLPLTLPYTTVCKAIYAIVILGYFLRNTENKCITLN